MILGCVGEKGFFESENVSHEHRILHPFLWKAGFYPFPEIECSICLKFDLNTWLLFHDYYHSNIYDILIF